MRRGLIWAGFVLSLAIAGGATWMFATGWAPSRATYAVQGIDVSEANGAIDWTAMKAQEVDFAYARATAGVGTRDASFAANWAGMTEAGVRRGAIHVFSLCGSAAEQADAFVTTVPRDPAALPAAIDLSFHEDCPARPARQGQ